jgi:hypothetical protein
MIDHSQGPSRNPIQSNLIQSNPIQPPGRRRRARAQASYACGVGSNFIVALQPTGTAFRALTISSSALLANSCANPASAILQTTMAVLLNRPVTITISRCMGRTIIWFNATVVHDTGCGYI